MVAYFKPEDTKRRICYIESSAGSSRLSWQQGLERRSSPVSGTGFIRKSDTHCWSVGAPALPYWPDQFTRGRTSFSHSLPYSQFQLFGLEVLINGSSWLERRPQRSLSACFLSIFWPTHERCVIWVVVFVSFWSVIINEWPSFALLELS